MSEKWTRTVSKDGATFEWKGYAITSQTGSMYRWWVTKGSPEPYRSKFAYVNDAKEACEKAYERAK